MINLSANRKRAEATLFLLLLCCPLVVLPTVLYDPISLPRFLVLVTLSFYLLVFILTLGTSNLNKKFYIFTLPFLIALILIILIHFSKPNIFFGIFGRNTGFITYLCLAILLYSTAVLAPKSENIIIKSIIFVSSINTVYGLIQLLNLDPIPWNLNFGRLVGTFGQPNFFSAMLGFGSIALLHKYLVSANVRTKLLIFFSISLTLFVCFSSQSIQGIYIFLIGAVILVYVKYVNGKKRFVTGSFLI